MNRHRHCDTFDLRHLALLLVGFLLLIGLFVLGIVLVRYEHLFFDPRSRFGAASIPLGIAGLVAVSEAVRRRHFPHRPAYWLRS